MKKSKIFLNQLLVITAIFFGEVFHEVNANELPKSETTFLHLTKITNGEIVLKSSSFNAKRRSRFILNGTIEIAKRGLNIYHLNSASTFEHKNFDTHGSEEEAAEFVKIIKELQKNKTKYIILAHDSAAKSLQNYTVELKKLGFTVLSKITNRQAYVMHNFNGSIFEKVDDVAVETKLEIPSNITDKQIYFPKPSYDFEPSNDRYIAHAGGEVNGVKSTNSLEALNQNYKKGFRMFELDIVETSDGKYVAAHDWGMWSRFMEYDGELPVSHAKFMSKKIYGDYTTMDMKSINKWFSEHPDATLITDKVNDPIRFANEFIDKDRLIMELFSLMSVEEASKNGINVIISQKPFNAIVGDKLSYLKINNVKHVAISRRIIERKAKLMLQLQKHGIRVYVYHVNFDPGKDEKYVQENELGLVYGMYADKWAFDEHPKKKN